MDCGRAKQVDWFLYGIGKAEEKRATLLEYLLNAINRVNFNILSCRHTESLFFNFQRASLYLMRLSAAAILFTRRAKALPTSRLIFFEWPLNFHDYSYSDPCLRQTIAVISSLLFP